MNPANHLRKLQDRFYVVRKPELAPCVHWAGTEQLPIHRWFRYREGYSPLLFSHFPKSRSRFDPFCGCGTTLLASSLQEVDSFGIDLNPLATFVATVKTRRYLESEREAFKRKADVAAKAWREYSVSPLPEYPLLAKLFQPKALTTLLRLKTFVDSVRSERVRGLLKLAWLSIIEDASNVFKEGNGLKYRNKRRRPGKYLTVPDAEWVPKYFGDDIPSFVIKLWRAKCSEISCDLEGPVQPSFREPEIRTGTCFDLHNLDFKRRADLIIFSPPYANRFDYFEAFKMELWLGDFVTCAADLAALRGKSMRNNLSAPRVQVPEWRELSPFLKAMDDEASSVRMGIKIALAGYFDDMRILLTQLRTCLARNGSIVVVVGNSAYAKSIIPTDLLICALAVEQGYRVQEFNVARSLHVSSQQRSELRSLQAFMRESIIILKSPNKCS